MSDSTNFQIDGLDLNLELDTESASGLEDLSIEDAAKAISDSFGFVLDDTVLDIELDTDDGSDSAFNITVDFDDGLESSILATTIDMSQELASYHTAIVNFDISRNNSLKPSAGLDIVKPSISDFKYITDVYKRSEVYRVFCKTLEDLIVDKEHNYNAETGYQEMKNTLISVLRYTPSIHESEFKATFEMYFNRNKRLNLHTSKASQKTSSDWVVTEDERNVIMINSVPFSIITRIFADDSSFQSRLRMADAKNYGSFLQSIESNANGYFYGDIKNGILSFLSSEEVNSKLHLTVDDSLSLSVGEILRRYIQYERSCWQLDPKGLRNISPSTRYSQELLVKLHNSLLDTIKSGSIAGEILCLLLEVIATYSSKTKDMYVFQQYVVGIASYLSASVTNPVWLNPVFYSQIGNSNSDKEPYQLGYITDSYHTVSSSSILCDVFGDNMQVHVLPRVLIQNDCALLPPREVINALRTSTVVAKHFSTALHYRYTPTYNWVLTLPISGLRKPTEPLAKVAYSDFGDSALLEALLTYKADFEQDDFDPYPVEITADGGVHILGVYTKSNVISIHFMTFEGVSGFVSNGTCFFDAESNDIVVQYLDANDELQQNVFNNVSYKKGFGSEDGENEVEDSDTLEGVESLINSTLVDMTDIGVNPYILSITKRVCDLASLDFDTELQSAQDVLYSMNYILGFNKINQFLGQYVLKSYVSFIEEAKGLDGYNATMLRELLDFVYPRQFIWDVKDDFTPELLEKLKSLLKTEAITEYDIVSYIRNTGIDILSAQHTVTFGIDKTSVAYSEFRALHYIPCLNAILTQFECQIVIMKALQSLDILLVMKRLPPFASAVKRQGSDMESIQKSEASVKRGCPYPKPNVTLTLSRAVVEAGTLPDRLSIVKSCILNKNTWGFLVDLEESVNRSNLEYCSSLLKKYKEIFHIPDTVSSLTETEFNILKASVNEQDFYTEHYDELLNLVQLGVLSELGVESLSTIKAFDILSHYGQYLNRYSKVDTFDTSPYREDFYSYVGSFFATYSPMAQEVSTEVDSGIDRISALTKYRYGSYAPVDIFSFHVPLVDLKYVYGTGNESGDNSMAEAKVNSDTDDDLFDEFFG